MRTLILIITAVFIMSCVTLAKHNKPICEADGKGGTKRGWISNAPAPDKTLKPGPPSAPAPDTTLKPGGPIDPQPSISREGKSRLE